MISRFKYFLFLIIIKLILFLNLSDLFGHGFILAQIYTQILIYYSPGHFNLGLHLFHFFPQILRSILHVSL